MKAININGEIKVFSNLPNVWQNILNFPKASDTVIRSYGFYDVIQPEYDNNLQRLGALYFDGAKRVFTYPVIDKTVEELTAEKEELLNSIENDFDISAIKKLLIILTKDILNSETVTQEQLDSIATIYPPYRVGKPYKAGDIFVYENKLYRVNEGKNHTSQADWIPSTTPSLYTKYTPAEVIAEWIQPLGAQDAYVLGAKVTHNGSTWESIVADNVWEPGVYGWTKL